jgi:O-antigen/teichoic acid export membrane protein
LSLAWIVVGYLSLFDLGIGRALTKLVADRLGEERRDSIPSLAWTSLLLMLFLGVLGAAAMLMSSSWLVHRLLKIPVPFQPEALHAFYLLGLSIPVVVVTSGFRGILEAYQAFRLANLIRIPMSVFSFVGPLLVFPFSHGLFPVIAVLVAGRLAGLIAHMLACFKVMPELRQAWKIDLEEIISALRLGSWMTVSNVVGPFMTYLDRFLIGALLSVAVVSYYSAPADMIGRVLVIPNALSGVLFPAFALSLRRDPELSEVLFTRGIKYMFLAVFPIVLMVTTLAPEGLQVWLGTAFAENGSAALRWLAVGTLLNCLAFIPFVLLQAAGRPRVTGILTLLELPCYLGALWLLVHWRGIEGAAMAWSLRASVDALVLFGFAASHLIHKSKLYGRLAAAISGALLVLCLAVLLHGLVVKLLFLSIILVSLAGVTWFWLLIPTERHSLLPFPGLSAVPHPPARRDRAF